MGKQKKQLLVQPPKCGGCGRHGDDWQLIMSTHTRHNAPPPPLAQRKRERESLEHTFVFMEHSREREREKWGGGGGGGGEVHGGW